jgi:hypothetical protein
MIDTVQGKAKLEAKIEAGRKSAMALIEKLHTDVPEDQIAKGAALRFGTRQSEPRNMVGGETMHYPPPELVMGVGDKGLRIHKHALSQLATRAKVPPGYVTDLAQGAEWQRKLAAGILNEHFHQGAPDARYLVRSVGGTARGVLSDKYRRLDNRPIVDALAAVAQQIGAVPVDGTFSDVRVALKIVLPQVYVAAGDVVAFGLEWGNSDYGASRNTLRGFFLRLECLNGATTENSLAQVHLGRALSEDIVLSQRTIELDTRATVSAMNDVVRSILLPERIKERIAAVERAASVVTDSRKLRTLLGKKLTKTETERVQSAFESNDVVNLPPGDTMWRASNAVSWIAGQKDVEADRRLALERIAGEFITGKRDLETVEA